MDIADLRLFEAVVRHGSMSRAAQALHTVQSNVTARLRQLEDTLGTPLLQRHSRGVSLTPAGQRLLPYAQAALHLLDDARQAVADEGEPAGPLAIGSLETTLALRLSPTLADYVAAHPAVDLSLRGGTTGELIDAVLAQQLDGALVCGPVDHPDLYVTPVFRERLVLLGPPGVFDLDALLARPGLRLVVLRASCSYRQRLEHLLAERGLHGRRLLEFGTLETLYACVAAGLGITLLPEGLVEHIWDRHRVSAHALPPDDAWVETVFIRHRQRYCSSAQAAFLRHLVGVGGEDRGVGG